MPSRTKSGIKILRLPKVEERTGLRKTLLYKLIHEDRFPRPIRLGGCRAVGWPEHWIDEWLREQGAA
jgi:prophage regulatory protein